MHTVRVREESSSVWVSNGDHAMQCSFRSFCASLDGTDGATASAEDLHSAVGTCLQRAGSTLQLPDDTRSLSTHELGRLAREGRLADVSVITES